MRALTAFLQRPQFTAVVKGNGYTVTWNRDVKRTVVEMHREGRTKGSVLVLETLWKQVMEQCGIFQV